MSAPDLLVVIDPGARLTDGESVRIARDVLCAGAPGTKVCLPEDSEAAARALARRGSRRPVVVGDDRALLRTVQLLHRDRDLAACALAMVPVGPPGGTALARSLGVPADAVAASRAVLYGTEHPLDLLVDDSGGVVLSALRVPAGPDPYEGARGSPGMRGARGRRGEQGEYGEHGVRGERSERGEGVEASGERGGARAADPGGRAPGRAPERADGAGGGGGADTPDGAVPGSRTDRAADTADDGDDESAREAREAREAGDASARGGPGARWVPPLRQCRSFVRMLARPLPLLAALTAPGDRRSGAQGCGPQRLRVEADGTVLADLDRPVSQVSLAPDGGGFAEVVVRQRPSGAPLRARAHTVTVSGPDFRYRADALVGGPVRARTWMALAGAWHLTLPDDPAA